MNDGVIQSDFADVRDIIVTDTSIVLDDAMNIIDASNTGAITLNVTDTANRIISEITGSGNSQTDLDEINTLVVSGGDVDATSADAIQDCS